MTANTECDLLALQAEHRTAYESAIVEALRDEDADERQERADILQEALALVRLTWQAQRDADDHLD